MNEPKQSKYKGWALIIVAFPVLVLIVVIIFTLPLDNYLPDFFSGAIEGIIAIGAFIIFARLITYGRRKKLPLAKHILAKNQSPIILYLRPFSIDGQENSGIYFRETFEQKIKKALSSIGTFVAIGKPGESIPQLGASRMYVDDQDWHKEVSSLISKSKLVLVHLGASKNLLWELSQAQKNLQPKQLVLCIPPRIEDYEEARRMIGNRISLPEPNTIGKARFICYQNNGNPTLLASVGDVKEFLQ